MEQVGERPKTRRGQSTKEDIKAAIEEALAQMKEVIANLPKLDAINVMLGILGKAIKTEI